MISAVILTYNEEINLPNCINTLDFVSDILVYDSFSTDKTVEIAVKMGAKVIQRKFDNYANQRNSALKEISAESDWILMLDADELVTQELRAEILEVTKNKTDKVTLYHVRRKDYFQGKWIKHSSGYPTWFGRLIRNGRVRVEREINEEYHTDGIKGYLQNHLLHYPFNKGLAHWFEKHNSYSSMEAINTVNAVKNFPSIIKLLSSDPTLRRQAQKSLIMKLPLRPLIVFFLFYIIRGGFLDGRAGYTFCKLRKTYEWMISLKIRELNYLK